MFGSRRKGVGRAEGGLARPKDLLQQLLRLQLLPRLWPQPAQQIHCAVTHCHEHPERAMSLQPWELQEC